MRVVGVEPEAGDDTARSLAAGERVHIDVPRTIADGLQTTAPGELTFAVNRERVDEIVTVSDDRDRRRDGVPLRPAEARRRAERRGRRRGAARRRGSRGARIGVVLSGGNVGAARFAELRWTPRLRSRRRRTSTTVRSRGGDLGVAVRASGRAPSRSAPRRCRRRRRSPRAAGSRSARNSPASWPRSMMRRIASIGFTSSPMRVLHLRAARDLAHEHAHDVGRVHASVRSRIAATCAQLLARRLVACLDRVDALEEHAPVLAEDRLEHLVLRREVVVEQAVRDARLLGDVADARGVEALAREHAHGGVEDQTPFLLRTCRALGQGRRRVVVASRRMQAARGDARRRPDPLPAGRVRVERAAAARRPRRAASSSRAATRCAHTAPEWHDALNAGKESVVCDLPADAAFARALLARADVVLESFRPGRRRPARRRARRRAGRTASTARSPASASAGAHEQRAGHDLNYLGWAGVLARHGAGAAAGAGRRSRRGRARRRHRDPRGAARARAHGRGRAHRRLDDARLAPARAGGRRVLDGRVRVLLDLRVRGRPPAHRRRARAEVLRAPLRARRPARARRAAVRRGPGGARARAARTFSRRAAAGRLAASVRDGRTSAWGRSRRWPRRPPSSARRRRPRAGARRAHASSGGEELRRS